MRLRTHLEQHHTGFLSTSLNMNTITVRSAADLKTNFVSDKPSSWYSELYRRDGLTGGHVIMLGSDDASK
jgi:hypothetical protein